MDGNQFSSSAPPSNNHTGEEEDEFIDMEIRPSSSTSVIGPSSISSSPRRIDFEFQTSTSLSSFLHSSYRRKVNHNNSDIPAASAPPSHADDLFHNGKLLPLHNRLLPPHHSSSTNPTTRNQTLLKALKHKEKLEAKTTAVKSWTAPPTISNTPLDSTNISPIESRRVSCDLNPTDDQYKFIEWSTETLSAFIGCSNSQGQQSSSSTGTKSSVWRKKLRIGKLRQTSSSSPGRLTHKLRTYFKSLRLHSKPAGFSVDEGKRCPATEASVGRNGADAGNIAKAKEYVNRYIKNHRHQPPRIEKWRSRQQQQQRREKTPVVVAKSSTFISMVDDDKEDDDDDDDDKITFTCHRRSFSGATTKRTRRASYNCYNSTSSSSSASSSVWTLNSNASSNCSSFKSAGNNGFHHQEVKLLKRNDSEQERSIEGAIAHCKMSQQQKENGNVIGDRKINRRSDYHHHQVGSCLLSVASRVSGSNGRSELCRI